MFSLDAPIIPGKRAAGIAINADFHLVTRDLQIDFSVDDSNPIRYHSPNVDIWLHNNRINQIMVHGEYKGKFMERITIGTPLDTLKEIGNLALDREDNLVIVEYPGICFEYDVGSPDSPITEIYVFQMTESKEQRLIDLHEI